MGSSSSPSPLFFLLFFFYLFLFLLFSFLIAFFRLLWWPGYDGLPTREPLEIEPALCFVLLLAGLSMVVGVDILHHLHYFPSIDSFAHLLYLCRTLAHSYYRIWHLSG